MRTFLKIREQVEAYRDRQGVFPEALLIHPQALADVINELAPSQMTVQCLMGSKRPKLLGMWVFEDSHQETFTVGRIPQ